MTNKKVYLEILRIIAIVFVLFAHLPGYRLFPIYTGVMQVVYDSMTNLSRMCIPLLFMVSGALLLKKEEDYSKVLKKRVSRFAILLVLFEGMYYLLVALHSAMVGEEVVLSLKGFILGVFEETFTGIECYWYLYTYLGFLFMLPLMQRIAKGMKKEDFWVLFCLHFVFVSLIPLLRIWGYGTELSSFYVTSDFGVPLAVLEAFSYSLFGYYLENIFDITSLTKKKVLILWALMVLALIIVDASTIYQGATTGDYSAENVYITDYIFGIIIYLLVKYWVVVKKDGMKTGWFSRFVCTLGSLTFGVYLLDPYLKLFFYEGFQNRLSASVPYIIITFIWIVISMTVCSLITAGLKKLPGFKKLL